MYFETVCGARGKFPCPAMYLSPPCNVLDRYHARGKAVKERLHSNATISEQFTKTIGSRFWHDIKWQE